MECTRAAFSGLTSGIIYVCGLPPHRNSSTVDDQRGSPPTVVRGKARGVGGIACEYARGIDARFWMASIIGLLVFFFACYWLVDGRHECAIGMYLCPWGI